MNVMGKDPAGYMAVKIGRMTLYPDYGVVSSFEQVQHSCVVVGLVNGGHFHLFRRVVDPVGNRNGLYCELFHRCILESGAGSVLYPGCCW